MIQTLFEAHIVPPPLSPQLNMNTFPQKQYQISFPAPNSIKVRFILFKTTNPIWASILRNERLLLLLWLFHVYVYLKLKFQHN